MFQYIFRTLTSGIFFVGIGDNPCFGGPKLSCPTCTNVADEAACIAEGYVACTAFSDVSGVCFLVVVVVVY